ncbi:MAG: DNA primase [Candidatus Uhrbacteria bacterium]|nr:DNA primase [Candidatus Uhrbacteria bacterium]
MDAPEEIKSRLDIADLIGEYLPLKPAGSGAFKALCPFHQEKTPSFYVSRPRQSWHCFGCDQGGDHFSFVEKIEGMEFREVLELLAQKTGVVLPKFDQQKASARKRLQEVNDLAVRFLRSALAQLPQAEHARQYLKQRGVDDLTADLFKLGYAPSEWTALSDALIKNGVTADELIQAGLSIKSDRGNGVYDRFRDRVMFPIADVHGNVVGFTGRVLLDDKAPSTSSGHKEAKYVNTPETPIYHKSSLLYGLDKAKGEIRRQNLAVIVEGNMDVVSSHQFNVNHVVAASGTALTVEQLALLKRFTSNLAIAFDQDAAGNAATLRGLDLARQQDFSIKIITLPPEAGKDPDEAVRKDPQIWKDAIAHAISIMEWIYRQAFRNRHAEKPEDKKNIAREVLMEIRHIIDPVERDHWLKKLAVDLDVREETLREVMGKQKGDMRYEIRNKNTKTEPLPRDHQREFEQRLFALMLYRPEIWQTGTQDLGVAPEEWGEAEHAALYTILQERYHLDESLPATADPFSGSAIRPPAGLTPDETKIFNVLALLGEQTFQDWAIDKLQRELAVGVAAMRRLRTTRERTRLEDEMRQAERVGDEGQIAKLLEQFKNLL